MVATERKASPGHVFVVRGRLENIDADAVVVPTDQAFKVEDHWAVLWPKGYSLVELKPQAWGRASALPARHRGPEGPDIWFIDVADDDRRQPQRTVDKIVEGVQKIAKENAGLGSGHDRPRRLLAMPTLGVGLGGLANDRGILIDELLAAATTAATENGLDIAIVALEASDYAAFQFVRRSHSTGPTKILDKKAHQIAGLAMAGELALFLGAGVSMSSGLPSWRKLTTDLMATSPKLKGLEHSLNDLDLAELISMEDRGFRKKIRGLMSGKKPSLAHALLAGLGCEEVVTTNFDLLYETAANPEPGNSQIAVLPWATTVSRRPWLLKMHGDVDHEKSIVLSRSDFVRYDSANGPAGAVVQSLMMSRHLLVIGSSMTDDNFLRLAHEVQSFLKANSSKKRKLGTVLTLASDAARKRLFHDSFDYVSVSNEEDIHRQSRDLAIFLDTVGMYASSDTSFLLDPCYRSLLRGDGPAVADQIQNLVGQVLQLARAEPNGPWEALWKSLQSFGASPEVFEQ